MTIQDNTELLRNMIRNELLPYEKKASMIRILDEIDKLVEEGGK